MGTFTKCRALAFRSRLDVSEILDRLQSEGARDWGYVDRDDLGRCVSSMVWSDDDEGDNRIRIFAEGDQYVVDILYRSARVDAEAEWASLESYIRTRLLPLLEAVDIHETDDYAS